MEQKIYEGIRNLVLVCVDTRSENEVSGRLYTRYWACPKEFSTFWEAVAVMEALYDTLNLPQSAVLARDFSGNILNNSQSRKELTAVQSNDEMIQNKGSIATFVVHVQYRQNATWQGKVLWTDKKIERSFRSALELMKLVDAALENSEPSEEKSLEGGKEDAQS